MAVFGIGSAIVAIASLIRGSSVFQAAIAVAKFLAIKALLIALVSTVAVVVFHNFLIDFMTDALSQFSTYLESNVSGNIQAVVHTFEGLGGYLADKLKIVESFSLIMSGLSVGIIRRMIPFVG